MLDFDLTELYRVETRSLKQPVKRNLDQFLLILCFNFQKRNGMSLSQIVMPYLNLKTFMSLFVIIFAFPTFTNWPGNIPVDTSLLTLKNELTACWFG
ncbi:MAG: ORF6N domain-containing protein [Saprospiraceae bacterium]|nr:ORF6N domain-containing protein [Candidatus Opimibacter skivensis]MBP6679735.1 ORF6N domain-containing protein [Saprospiraceae bacterium]